MKGKTKQSNNLAGSIFFVVLSAYQPADINSYEDVVVATAEVIADANFVCPANKFARELTMIGSKVSVVFVTPLPPSHPQIDIPITLPTSTFTTENLSK